jgi:hypothetical protein
MKQPKSLELPAFFVVTVSHAGTEILPTAPPENDILTVAEVAEMLKCKPSSIYNLTRHRGRARYDNPIPVLGSRWVCDFVAHVFAWLKAQAASAA